MHIDRRAVIVGLAATGFGFARKAHADVQNIGGHAFGSSWRITAGHQTDGERMGKAVNAIVGRINHLMSPYLPLSEVSRFNDGQADIWHKVPSELCHVASEALRIADLTGGAFDPTVGPLVSRLGFGPIQGMSGLYAGIDVRAHALRKADPHLTLDLCGIAKGYALDQIIDALSGDGMTNALVEVGGEVRALGHHPDGRAWHVAISDPTQPDFSAYRIVAPEHLALATSGHAVNGLRGAVSTSHIIDPIGKRSANTALASVSVLAATATEADALATALCAAGPVMGPDLAHRLNVSALFVTDGREADPEILTGAFARHILI